MLPSSKRLHQDDVRRVLREGNRRSSRHFLLSILNTEQPQSRASCAVSKKVIARAVERNRLRRRMYGALHEVLPAVLPSNDLVLTAKRDAHLLPHAEMVKEIQAILQK